jgi:hypothetical protein
MRRRRQASGTTTRGHQGQRSAGRVPGRLTSSTVSLAASPALPMATAQQRPLTPDHGAPGAPRHPMGGGLGHHAAPKRRPKAARQRWSTTGRATQGQSTAIPAPARQPGEQKPSRTLSSLMRSSANRVGAT